MYFAKVLPYIMFLTFAGCGNITDDLQPSSEDKRAVIETGVAGFGEGQIAPEFTVYDTLGNSTTLDSALTGSKGIVLYFTMWCPLCDSHQDNMQNYVVPDFSADVKFYLVDYITASVENSRASQISNGYTTFNVLADIGQDILTAYKATMGTTVVIDSAGIIRMNEEYKKATLIETLGALQ